MGNSMGGKSKTVKVMKIDGTILRLKPPTQALDVLRDHPGYVVLEAGEVKRIGLRAEPLHPDRPLNPGQLYFLVELPRFPDQRAPRRAMSGIINVDARDRLERLKLTRRAVSDLSLAGPYAQAMENGAVRLKVRLPKAQVAKLVEESRDAEEAAEKIVELCCGEREPAGAVQPRPALEAIQEHRKEKRMRFAPMHEEIIV